MPGPDESPEQANRQESQNDITGINMQVEEFIFGDIGDREGGDKGPMEDPYQRVPYFDQFFSGHDLMLQQLADD